MPGRNIIHGSAGCAKTNINKHPRTKRSVLLVVSVSYGRNLCEYHTKEDTEQRRKKRLEIRGERSFYIEGTFGSNSRDSFRNFRAQRTKKRVVRGRGRAKSGSSLEAAASDRSTVAARR